jgi:hypothetical protein
VEAPQVIEIPGLFTNRIVRKLTISDDGVKLERPTTFAPAEFIPAAEIEALRYGARWLRGYAFPIGRHYFIEVKDEFGKVTSINLKSIYGIKRNTYDGLWRKTIGQLWAYYYSNIFNHYCMLYSSGQSFELSGIKFLSEGIGWGKNYCIIWENIALSNYAHYFAIYPKQNPKHHKAFYFARDWNAFILQALLKKIIAQYKQPQIGNN